MMPASHQWSFAFLQGQVSGILRPSAGLEIGDPSASGHEEKIRMGSQDSLYTSSMFLPSLEFLEKASGCVGVFFLNDPVNIVYGERARELYANEAERK